MAAGGVEVYFNSNLFPDHALIDKANYLERTDRWINTETTNRI